MLYLIAVLETLFYLCSIPVRAAFRLNTESAAPFGAGVGLFHARPATRGPKPKRRVGTGAVLRMLRRLRFASITLRGSVNLGDAAATALACGALRALSPSIGIRAARVTVDISPRFDGKGPAVALAGTIEARVGQIILAAARSGMDYLSGRIAPWTDIRSKAS